MIGPLLRNHSSTVTRATRPVTVTCTALLIFSTRPVGRGWIGSIQPWPASTPAQATTRTPAVGQGLEGETLTSTPVRDGKRDGRVRGTRPRLGQRPAGAPGGQAGEP